MAVTKAFKVYGQGEHRQRESFCKSYSYDFSRENYTRFITVLNADVTGTNEYSLVIITRDTEEECFDELNGQLSDGIFENSRTGFVKEVDLMNYRG